MIRIELLSAENFKQDSLDNYPRKQDVKKVYRKLGGEYILEDCVYTEDWNMEKRRSVAKDISGDDYVTYLAIENDEVVEWILRYGDSSFCKCMFRSRNLKVPITA